jgi:hypothetical protein
MQADNDNLDGCVSGFDDWTALHEAARKVVEACARERAHLHQVEAGNREVEPAELSVIDDGRHHLGPGSERVGSHGAKRRGTWT